MRHSFIRYSFGQLENPRCRWTKNVLHDWPRLIYNGLDVTSETISAARYIDVPSADNGFGGKEI